jgi:hypothetical protein
MHTTAQNATVQTEAQLQTPTPAVSAATPQTEMIMLQKADVWMSQFKTRLNIGIVALIALWGLVSYLKSADMHLEARSLPEAEQILADGSADEVMSIQAVPGSLERGAAVEPVVEKAAESKPTENAVKDVPSRTVKKSVAQKTGKSKSRPQKKPKKSLGSKPAL